MRRLLGLLALTTILMAAACVQAAEIRPHMAGWEQILSLEYGPGQAQGCAAAGKEGPTATMGPRRARSWLRYGPVPALIRRRWAGAAGRAGSATLACSWRRRSKAA